MTIMSRGTVQKILYQITNLILTFLNYYSYSPLYSCFTHVWWFCLPLLLFPMDGSRVIESLGSLWFLTNIFSSKNKSLDSTSDGIATQERINNESPKEESTEPISPISFKISQMSCQMMRIWTQCVPNVVNLLMKLNPR